MFYLLNILIQMKILLNNQFLNKSLDAVNDIGFIPTMGGIHKGHISLIKKSNKICKKTIVSIFVNPKQFNDKKDLKKYPSNINKDLLILKRSKIVDFVYVPKFNDIYSSKNKSKIIIDRKDKILCAKFRKGHFEGVLDVMDRLTNLIKPKKIFMGKKDFQQFYLVKNYLEKKYTTKVIGCETIRDKNKLALSSRNYLFSKTELNTAGIIAKNLFLLKKKISKKNKITKILLKEKKRLQKNYNIKIEYLELRDVENLLISNKSNKSRIFISYYLNNVRVIDNF